MRADYDLVIIGDSYSARWAALKATQHYARVALVLQTRSSELTFAHVLNDLSNLITIANFQGVSLPFRSVCQLRQWMQLRREAHLMPLRLPRLIQQGVDVISESGQFVETPFQSPTFEVQNRQLRSTAYLLALPRIFSQSPPGKNEHHSPQTFLEALEDIPPPKSLVLEGQSLWEITLAQVLQYLGYTITLSIQDRLLETEDEDISFFVQCILESKGIELSNSHNQPSTSLCLNPKTSSFIKTLALERVGIQVDVTQPDSDILINSAFQTENPNIYVCGRLANEIDGSGINLETTAIALNNALFKCRDRQTQVSQVSSPPIGIGFYRSGLTEAQAKHRFPKIEVMKRSLEYRGCPIFCKLIATTQGKLLGMHLIGLPTDEIRVIFQQIMDSGLFVSQLDEISISDPILLHLFADFVHRWLQIKSPKTRDRRERYFRAKRKRFS